MPTSDCDGGADDRVALADADSEKSPSTDVTCATNASCEANGSASQILSSTVQPSARSTFSTPESTAGTGGPNCTFSDAAHPFGHASVTIGITSEAVAPSASPPPETVGAFVTDAGAVLAVLTVTLMSG